MSPTLAVRTLERRARAIAQAAVEREGDAVRAVLLGGGVAEGDAVAVEDGGVLHVLSDLDLYVIARDRASAERLRAARAAWTRVGDPPHGVRLLRDDEVGVYDVDDFLAQPDRPATRTLAARHVVLHGDASLLEAWRSRARGPLPPEEGLVLVEHRMLEWRRAARGVSDDPASREKRWLEALARLKLAEAAIDAVRIASGGWTPGWRARRDAAVRMARRASLDGALRRVADAVAAVEDRAAWVAALGPDPDARAARAAAISAWRRAGAAGGRSPWLRFAGAPSLRRARLAGRVARRWGRRWPRAALGAGRFVRTDVVAALRAAALAEAMVEQGDASVREDAARLLERTAGVVAWLGGDARDPVGEAERLYRRIVG